MSLIPLIVSLLILSFSQIESVSMVGDKLVFLKYFHLHIELSFLDSKIMSILREIVPT